MIKPYRSFLCLTLVILVTSCAAPAVKQPILPAATQPTSPTATQPVAQTLPEIHIVRHPEPVDYSGSYSQRISIPKFDPNSDSLWQVDLRSQDLTKIDMTGSLADLLYADFDSKTQWPTSDKLLADFDWQKIMELGKDPGLGIRQLHEQGITGKGVGLAIIDLTLLVDHPEYKDRLRLYEEADDVTGGWVKVQMHGPAVASIAAGKSAGVAPDADLYYIATGDCGGAASIEDLDFSCRAKAIRRIVEINKTLPEDRKIRVLSMSFGWGPDSKGYEEITKAVNEAKADGIFVISSSLSQTYGLNFQGLGREPLADPNQFTSYEPGLWWQDYFYKSNLYSPDTLLVPMDSRTTASPTGIGDYVFYREGGWSWAIPYLAGMYALAVQVKPDITPEEFWDAALKAGRSVPVQHDGKEYQLGVILDPQGLIQEINNR